MEPLAAPAAVTLPCGHAFHGACISEVFRRGDPKCPICRDEPPRPPPPSPPRFLWLEEQVDAAAALRQRVLRRARTSAPPRLRERWVRARKEAAARWREVRALEDGFLRSDEHKALVRRAAGADRSEKAAGAKYVASVLEAMPQADATRFLLQNPDFTLRQLPEQL